MRICGALGVLALISVADADTAGLVGKWSGKASVTAIPIEVQIEVRAEGALFVIDITRQELFGTSRERIYVDGNVALATSNLVATPRKDAVANVPHGVGFRSKPWDIGLQTTVVHSFSLEMGWYEPPMPARIYIHAPVHRPSMNVLTYKWSSELSGKPLSETVAVLIRQAPPGAPSFIIGE